MATGKAQVRGTDALTPDETPVLRLKLAVVEGPDFGAEWVLGPGSYRVGSAEGAELVLHDSTVSRGHLRIDVLEAGLRLTDLGSRNGSRCDGKRFTSIEVGPGALIQIGRTRLKVLPVTAPSAALRPSERTRFGELLGRSLAMREIFALLERIAASDATVLIQGETGTGKELCAAAIHLHSARAAGPLVVCDLASLSSSLIDSELFGHERAAFTGAEKAHTGLFQRAHGGTLFLDEIGELPLELQPRLLRAIERREVRRVGSDRYSKIDVRFIGATHRDLAKEVEAGRFRRDLYERIAVLRVELPPLRERREDVPLLLEHFVARDRSAAEFPAELKALLSGYDWPGNVRQLKNVVERVLTLGPAAALPYFQPKQGRGPTDFKSAKEQAVLQFERIYLDDLLRRCEGNVSRAAAEAGMDRTYLHRLLKRHGLRAK